MWWENETGVTAIGSQAIQPSEESHIDIIPIGCVDPLAVSIVAANLQTIMGLNAAILDALPEDEGAYLPLRNQYSASRILNVLEATQEGATFKLGVVQVDLCTPILKFVFGESQLGGKAAVVSLYRLAHNDPKKLYLRGAKVSLHETGHLLGIGHCRAPDCLMAFSGGTEKLDSLPLKFCDACEYEIARSLKHLFSQK